MTIRKQNLELYRLLVQNKVSLDTLTDWLHCGRVSQTSYDRYCNLWDWGAMRFSGGASWKQDKYVAKYGIDALRLRFDRIKRITSSNLWEATIT